MSIHKVIEVRGVDPSTLLVRFDNAQLKKYDMSKWLQHPAFAPLRSPDFFKAVKVDVGGCAVYWNEDIDISEYELWCNGVDSTH